MWKFYGNAQIMQIFGQFVLRSGATPGNWVKSLYFMNWLRFKVLRNQKQSSQSQNQRYTLGLKRYLTMTFGRKINKNTHWIKSYWTRSFILDCVFSYLDWIKGFTFRISVFCPNAVKYKPGKTSSSVTFHAANFFWIVFNQKEIVQLDQCC